MKRILFTIIALAAITLSAAATDLTGKRIYINPGHGSFGPNDRPMATIPYPNLPSTGMPDTTGFYESNTDLWKCLYLGQRLQASGAYIMYSRTQNGPWPYTMINGDYPDYSYSDYTSRPDYEQFNRRLSEICEEVEANNMDLFISVHSNAATDGGTTNYPLFLFRGHDAKTTTFEQTSYNIGQAIWPWRWEMFGAGFDQASAYSATSMNVRGDIDFYGDEDSRTSAVSGNTYTGYLGVLKHGTPGGLWEGYFHTYQPARHRALNVDYCNMEGIGYYRGIMDYFGADADTLGYICGTVKDLDTKIVHSLFKYTPKTNDQWLPCNGATVYLLNTAGDTLQQYQVDTLYNGIFAFYGLTPGTYRLFATCPGYFDLDAEQAGQDIVVTANHTTYPFLQLRDTAWEPDPIVYETYPDKSKNATGLDGKYNFGAAQSASFASTVAGKLVRQVLVRDDAESYVLALDTTAHASYIYKINTLTGELIQQVSTEGTQGQYYPVYSIAFTADSVLVGCNYEECQFTPEGTFRTYYWNMADLSAAPTAWFTSRWAGNFYNANVGNTFAVSGPLATATVFTDARTTGSSLQFRIATMSTDNYQLVSTLRNQDAGTMTEPLYGHYSAVASPNADDNLVLAGENRTVEVSFNADAQAPTYNFDFEGAYGAGAMKYAGKSVVAAPVMANGTVTGVKMFNITSGMSQATATTTNIVLNDSTAYCSVKPLADGKDIVLYVATDKAIYRYTTAGQTQPVFSNIYAYDLEAELNDSTYEFRFKLNTEPTEANIIFRNEEGTEVGRMAVASAQEGQNSLNLDASQLPAALPLRWEVEASAPTVGNWGEIMKKSTGFTRVFNAVNVFPETDHFGTIYLMDRAGANSQASGMYVMNADYSLQNTTAYKGQQRYYSSPYRFGIASDGWVFVGDWGDPHSGVYTIDPADPEHVHNTFFAGTQNGDGLWKNAAGVEEGSSTSSVFVYGTGADTKLLVYNEDPGSTLPTNGLCIYNIGQPDGTILHSWDGAPSATITFAGQANTNGNVWGCSHGVWVSQHRSAGNNNASATSLRFYTWDGECTYASHQAPVDAFDQLIIEGSLGSVFALSPDEKTIILNGVDNDFLVFDIKWTDNTPALVLKYRYKHSYNTTSDNNHYEILQMNWDYAGNLIASGGAGVIALAAPKEINKCTTPAREMLEAPVVVEMIANPIGADGRFIVKYDCETGEWAEANPEIGETFTFAVDITGSWLEEWVNASDIRGIAFNKWSSRDGFDGDAV
ncbi:MAG: carboxypeptidase regulatory-like domain-containing protein, partial [Bacteroidales bacterium]|nr:carboxypeptidase regulatory-like domain-containing protein [Candidatus Colicola faecequi]